MFKAIYSAIRVSINRKTLEKIVEQLPDEEKFVHLGSWKMTKDLSYPVLTNFKIDSDEHGVKEVTYMDSIGRIYKEVRKSFIPDSPKASTFNVKSKIKYFNARVDDKSLTVGQREYARNRLAQLQK